MTTTDQMPFARRLGANAPTRALPSTRRCATAIAALCVGLATVPAMAQQGDLGITTPPQPETVEAQQLEPTQSTGPGPFSGGAPTAAERAEGDRAVLAENAETIWRSTQTAAAPLLSQLDLRLLALTLAAAFGGYVGARIRSRRRAEPVLVGDGFATDQIDMRRVAEPRVEPTYGLAEPKMSDAIEPTVSPPPAIERKNEKVEEAERLLAFFKERFDVDTTTADDAIDYLTRLGSSVDGMRRKLSTAEAEIEKLQGAAERSESDGPVSSAWDVIGEAARCVRAASQALRSDQDFVALAHEAQIEETIRELTALRMAFLERGVGLEPEVIEDAWPHALMRAEALVLAYYPTTDDWRDLRLGLAAAATAVRMLLRIEGVFVEHARLFTDLADGEGEVWSDTSEGLRELRPVRQAVLTSAGARDEAFVIDCESFGFYDRERDLQVRSKVIVFNRAEWR